VKSALLMSARRRRFLELHPAAAARRQRDDVPPVGIIKEVSILSAGVEPAEPLARVAWVGEKQQPAARSTTSDRASSPAMSPDDITWQLYAQERAREGVIVRRNTGHVIGVR
jgi:hypothetical protein